MVLRKLMGLLACTLIVSFATVSMADVPNLDLSYAETAAGEQVSLFNLPDGSGAGLDAAYAYGGMATDATITLTLVNDDGEGISGYAAEELWLETTMGGLVACADGTIADSSTDGSGMTMWQDPLFAGGYTDIGGGELTFVMVSGDALTMPGMDVQHNSADIDGNGVANISDIAAFTQILFGAYDYAGDFIWDGVINLSDVALMTQGNGTACP
jgi:hypothetical protein